MTELTDEAVKSLAHKYRFAKDDNERTIAKTAEALLDARAERDRLRADAQAVVALALETAAQQCEFRDHSEGEEETEFDRGYDQACDECATIVRALAPADVLEAIQALQKELDDTQTQLGDWIVRADEASVRAENAEAELAAAQQREAGDAAQSFDKADWFWRTMDPDDCGDSPEEAINRAMVGQFCVCEIASSFSGPTRYGFVAPVLDSESDDEEFVHFATQQEAIDAAKARAALSNNGRGE